MQEKDAYLYNFCLEQGRKFIIGRFWPRVRLRWLPRWLGIGQILFGRRHGRHIGVQNNETPAMLVYQKRKPVGIRLFSCIETFFCANKFA